MHVLLVRSFVWALLSFAQIQTPVVSLRAVKTSQGEMVITGVQRGDRGPLDCEVGLPFCREAKPGMQIVTVLLDVKGGGEIEVDAAVSLLGQAVPGMSKESAKQSIDAAAHLLTANGSPIYSELGAVRHNKATFGIGIPGRLRLISSANATGISIIFEVPAGATGLQFVWPGNPPIPVGR